MAYCGSPYLAKARGKAMKAVVINRKPQSLVVKQTGVDRTTIWRWKKKWDQQNTHLRFTNDNRPHCEPGQVFRWQNVKWDIPTLTSAPHTHPNRIAEPIVQRIITLRQAHHCCAEVIHHEL